MKFFNIRKLTKTQLANYLESLSESGFSVADIVDATYSHKMRLRLTPKPAFTIKTPCLDIIQKHLHKYSDMQAIIMLTAAVTIDFLRHFNEKVIDHE